jgi:hypothetical protein
MTVSNASPWTVSGLPLRAVAPALPGGMHRGEGFKAGVEAGVEAGVKAGVKIGR